LEPNLQKVIKTQVSLLISIITYLNVSSSIRPNREFTFLLKIYRRKMPSAHLLVYLVVEKFRYSSEEV
jgi:hypothetical protein